MHYCRKRYHIFPDIITRAMACRGERWITWSPGDFTEDARSRTWLPGAWRSRPAVYPCSARPQTTRTRTLSRPRSTPRSGPSPDHPLSSGARPRKHNGKMCRYLEKYDQGYHNRDVTKRPYHYEFKLFLSHKGEIGNERYRELGRGIVREKNMWEKYISRKE